jgi:hypothetical protein
MRETVLGVAVVTLILGVAIGRATERARRSYKDWDTARTTTTKARQIVFSESRRAGASVLLFAAILAAIFFGAMNWPG